MKEIIGNFFNSAKENISKHSPEILTGLSIVGFISSIAMAIKATPTALFLIEEEKNAKKKNILKNNPDISEKKAEELSDLTLIEKAKAAWRPYLPTLLMTGTSVACSITANTINLKRNGALVTAFGITQETLREYQKEVVKEIGAKKEESIRNRLAQKEAKDKPYNGPFNPNMAIGEQLFYDKFSGRWFISTMPKVKTAENNVDRDIINHNYASVNDFYDYLDAKELPPIESGKLGWNSGEKMNIDYVADIREEDGLAYIILDYEIKSPSKNYDKFS